MLDLLLDACKAGVAIGVSVGDFLEEASDECLVVDERQSLSSRMEVSPFCQADHFVNIGTNGFGPGLCSKGTSERWADRCNSEYRGGFDLSVAEDFCNETSNQRLPLIRRTTELLDPAPVTHGEDGGAIRNDTRQRVFDDCNSERSETHCESPRAFLPGSHVRRDPCECRPSKATKLPRRALAGGSLLPVRGLQVRRDGSVSCSGLEATKTDILQTDRSLSSAAIIE